MPVAVSTSLIAGSVSSSSSSIPKDCLGTLPASESVHAVAFNPFEWAAGLVAYGGKKSIIGECCGVVCGPLVWWPMAARRASLVSGVVWCGV